jgi:hypothetical protein
MVGLTSQIRNENFDEGCRVTPQLPFCGSKKGMTYPPLWRFCSRGDYDPHCPETLLDKIWVGVYAEDMPVSILEL